MNKRIRRRLLILLMVTTVPGAVWIGLTWRMVRQEQFNDHLIAACNDNDAVSVGWLLHQGANPNAHVKLNFYPSWRERWIARLERREIPMLEGDPVLHVAISQLLKGPSQQERQQAAMNIRQLLQAGADPDRRNLDGDTALTRLVDTHATLNPVCIPLVNALVARGVDVNRDQRSDQTPLMLAVSNDNLPMMKRLLSHGARVNVQDATGSTALKDAVLQGSEDSVRLLLEHGADPNIRDGESKTALYLAVYVAIRWEEYGYRTMIRLLIAHGANPNIATKSGVTPLMLVKDSRHASWYANILTLLRQAGARK